MQGVKHEAVTRRLPGQDDEGAVRARQGGWIRLVCLTPFSSELDAAKDAADDAGYDELKSSS